MRIAHSIAIVALLLWGNLLLHATVQVPSIFSDHMVLQRDKPVPIWGWAAPNEKVTVSFAGQEKSTVTGKDGNWMIRLDPMQASAESRELTIMGTNKIVRKDVLVGEVWLASGQSNMEWGLLKSEGGEATIAAGTKPHIRLLNMSNQAYGSPQVNVHSSIHWHPCTPESLKKIGTRNGSMSDVGFSAVAYHFAVRVHNELKVPVGIIQSAWGGSTIAPWIPAEAFHRNPKFKDISDRLLNDRKKYEEALLKRLEMVKTWVAATEKAKQDKTRVPDFPGMPQPKGNKSYMTALYNGKIHPLVPYGLRGFLWYQGESDMSKGMEYFHLMQALISGWRSQWEEDTLPFYFVQLAPFGYNKPSHILPEFWEAQTKALEIPHTGMAVISDVGNVGNLHPGNKQDVGKRLALLALAKTYGVDIPVYSSALYENFEKEGDAIRVHFKHTGGKLGSRDGKPLNWFEIAGEDGTYVEAEAIIDGDSVLVSSSKVKDPVNVRFAWHQKAVPNLINVGGLPTSAFRTHTSE